RETSPDSVEHLPARGEHAEGSPGTAINHRLSIDEDLELAIVTANHLDVDPQLATQPGRHPGGMQPGDSVGAIPNGDPAHDDLPRRTSAWLALALEDDPAAPLEPFVSRVGIIGDGWSVDPLGL